MNNSHPSRFRRCAPLAVAILISACASTGGLAPVAKPRAEASIEANRALAGAPLSPASWPAADWWTRFGDRQLNALIDEALANSPSLGMARARLERVVGLAAVAGAPLTPQVNGEADVTRQRFSANGIFPPPIGGAWFTQSELALQFGYELDFWGKNRAAYDAALGQVRAAQIDVSASKLLLAAAVAHAYARLGRAFDQLDVAQAVLKQRETIFDLTKQRLSAGLDTRVELKQAEASIPAARQRIAQLEEEIALARSQLAALTGNGPDRGLSIERPSLNPQAIVLPSALPADLLGRRPDVIAQRSRVQAARRDIDSARAQFYPNINLTALVGVQSVTFSKLLESGSENPSVGAALQLPLFDGGRLRGNLRVKDADYDLSVEQYNQTLLDAMREVVDQVASLRSVDVQGGEAKLGFDAADEAYRIALARYRAGLGNFLQVLIAETQVLDQKTRQVDLRYRGLDLSIDLIRALGGGFEAPSANERPS
jgi:NodT family efflux transporter outer membrane factor (OMF) lipoprotein